jgi:transcriptional regulator with XRE-family HTH domain
MVKEYIVSNCEIGVAIKRRRHELAMSQEALANLLEVSFQQVQRYENGTDRLNVERLQALAHALEVPIGYFFAPENIGNDLQETDSRELLAHFRKIRAKEIRAMLLEFTKACAKTSS